MNDIKNRKKVRKRKSGFSLVELLVAMGVMLLFTIIMSTLMETATLAYKKSVDCSNADVAVSNTINSLRLELTGARKAAYVSGTQIKDEKVEAYAPSFGVTYTDALTGAECLCFMSNGTDTIPATLYVYKYGEIRPLVFTEDDLNITVENIIVNEKSVIFQNIVVMKDGQQYTSVDETTVKLK